MLHEADASFSFWSSASPAPHRRADCDTHADSASQCLQALEVEFNTGETFRYPAELLRVESPSAEAPQLFGRPRLVHGRRHVGIMQAEPVGRYAVRLQFDDLHGTGLFTWGFLHELGRNKFTHMRRYIQALREQGLSRDPPPRKSPSRLQKPEG